MTKVKKQTTKSKKKATKYSKLMLVASKELAGKKKALVSAERALANAKNKHEELVSEVARLDMVERSLKALVEGTEPPTNVKYIYNYPQWVWQQPVYQTPYTQPGWTFTNTPNLPGYTTISGLQGHNSSTVYNNSVLTCNTTTGAGSFDLNGQMMTVNSGNVCTEALTASSGTITVDLSSGAGLTDEPVSGEYLEAIATVANG